MKKILRKCVASILVCCLMETSGLVAVLADEVEMNDLFDIVSKQTVETATLSQIPITKTPGTVSLITQKQIENYGASNLDEVIRLLPGVDVRMMTMGYSAFIRGFGDDPFQSGIQYQVDGLLYNSSDKGGTATSPAYNAFPVPVGMIKQVEAVRGPVSSLYGANALYGVINVLTKSGKDLKNGGRVSVRASDKNSGRDLQNYALVYGGEKGDFDWVASGEFLSQLGPMRFNKDSRIRDTNVATKIKYKDLGISYYGRAGETDPFLFSEFDGFTNKTYQNVNLIGATYSKEITEKFTVNSKSSYLNRRGSNCQMCHNPGFFKTTASENQDEEFYRAYQQIYGKVSPAEGHQVTLGTELTYDKEHMESGVIREPNVVNRTYAGFLQYVAKIRENVTATVGVRQDQSDWSNAGGLTSPRALLVYNPLEKTTFRASYARAHRVPTFHDLYAFFKFLPRNPLTGRILVRNQFVMGNPDLRPETIDTFDLGAEQWITKKAVLKLNGYYSVVQNQIQRKELTTAETISLLPNGKLPNGESPTTTGPAVGRTYAVRWVNLPFNALILGAELEFQFMPYRFLELNFDYSYKDVSYGSDMSTFIGPTLFGSAADAPNAPRHLFGAGATAYPVKNLMVNVTGKFKGEFFPTFGSQIDISQTGYAGKTATPGILLLDFHIRYRLPYDFKLSFIGRNMLNQEAFEWKLPVSPQLATGRDLFLQLAYDFGGYKSP